MRPRFIETMLLALLVVFSFGIRLALAARGGQLFFPDEYRISRADAVAQHLVHGDLRRAVIEVVGYPAHSLFLVWAAPATLAAKIIANRLSLHTPDTFRITAALLAFAGALLPLLVALLARTTSSANEALAAGGLTAASAALLYTSPHLLPYDLALALALLAILLVLYERFLGAGLLLGIAFLTYNGYWPIVAVALVIAMRRRPSGALRTASAACAPLLAFEVASRLLLDRSYLAQLRGFGATVTQGSYAEGPRLALEFLRAAEGGLVILWGLAAAMNLIDALRKRRVTDGAMWTLSALAIYAMLALASAGLEVFVVYGRQTRQLVPFLCLAVPFAWRIVKPPALAATIAIVLVSLQAFRNVRPLIDLHDPGEIHDATTILYGATDSLSTFPILPARPRNPAARIILVNSGYFYPVDTPRPIPTLPLIAGWPHPLSIPILQYESYDDRQRALLRKTRIEIRERPSR